MLVYETMDGFMDAVLELLPQATLSEDSDGQIIVHTGLRESADGSVVTAPDVTGDQ